MLDLCWYAVLTAFGLYAAYTADRHYSEDTDRFMKWVLPAIGAHILALVVMSDLAVVPVYEWLDQYLPSKNSALHMPTAVLLTAVGCFAYVLGCSLLPTMLDELRTRFKPSQRLSGNSDAKVIGFPKAPR